MSPLNWYRDRAFKIKIALLITLAVSAAIAVVSAGFVIFEISQFKKDLESERLNLLGVVGANMTAAIIFDDVDAIEETLSVFEELPEVSSVILFSEHGEIKHQHPHFDDAVAAPKPLASIGSISERRVVFKDGLLTVQVPIHVEEELIGALQATTTLQKLRSKIENYILIALIVTIIAVSISFLIGQLFGRFLARPIEELTQTMSEVTRTNNYELSAPVISNDEVGKLAGGFNEMLREVRHRDDSLEQTVAERTQELVKEKERVEAASKAKSTFLANMSHELRTPMNGVMGMAELLTATELSDKQKMFADTIYRSGSALLTILNDILDFSKIEADKLELDPTPFELRSAIEDVATLLGTAARKKEIDLIVSCAPSLPSVVEGDVGRIRQVLTNLVGNALKFTHEGYVLVNASGVSEGGRLVLRISIEDTGIGIAPEKIDAVFQTFTQAESSTTRNFGGTGLGLAISQSLVEMMGGKIGARSEIGFGSTFWIEIDLPVVEERSPAPEHQNGLEKLPVLVADNRLVSRQALADNLTSLSAAPSMAKDEETALEALRNAAGSGRPFSLAMISHDTSKLDSLALARAIRIDPRIEKTPLIVLSSTDDDVMGQQFQELGAIKLMAKPVQTAQLIDAILGTTTDKQVETLRSAVVKETQAPEETSECKVPGRASNNRVLVAEDNMVNRMVMESMIDATQFDIDFAENGKIAYDAYRENKFDLIFMDISMPEMDGIEATKAIRSHEHAEGRDRTPIIALTAHAMNGDRQRFLDAGMDDYVSKPVKKNTIEEILGRWLAKKDASLSGSGAEDGDAKSIRS